jgi:DNA-binding PadR family transcriptional regulator
MGQRKKMKHDLFKGLIRLHILYHASKEELYGLWVIEELRRHGYNLSPGTLYPILHKMEERGYLKSEKELVNGKIRRIYRISPDGEDLLKEARIKIKELFGELFENEKK